MTKPLTLFQKVWNNHVVVQEPDSPAVLYIDLQLVHEVTSPQAFDGLRRRGLKVRRPDRTVGTMDHSIPTLPPSVPISDELAAKQMRQMEVNAKEFNFRLYGKDHPQRGIVHVIGPELMVLLVPWLSESVQVKLNMFLLLNAYCSVSQKRWKYE
jgi:3-isopropylmalate/(R)-2-methylmalate dehydratase large subunit